jgi:succinate dehydrogenase / fumarate reductase cytochrome b subunit
MATKNRPISPHLQIYSPQITSTLSILHRLTGIGLAIGSLMLAWWLIAAASGPESFAIAQDFIGSIIGRTLLLAFTAATFYHLCNGIRHLFWDVGMGFDIQTATRNGWLVVIVAAVLTLVAFGAGYSMKG